MARAAFLVLFLLSSLSIQSSSRPIEDDSTDLLSDGICHAGRPSFLFLKNPFSSSSEMCEQTYGFFPCSTTVLGNVFLVLVYGYIMFLAARYLSTGSELLLELLGPGIVGGLFLPVLGSLPDALLILASGLSGSKETAQNQVLIGMGLLAGSTIMLLTLLWGSCVVAGRHDLSENEDTQAKKQCILTGSGVTTDVPTGHTARIMVISVIPFIIVQAAHMSNLALERHLGVLIALIVSIAFVILYCFYQVFQPWIQKRRLAYVKHKQVMSGLLTYMQRNALGRLYKEDGQPNTEAIKKVFERINLSSSGCISMGELKALIIGVKFEEIDLDTDDAVKSIMEEFDTSGDNCIDAEEFANGISKWLRKAKRLAPRATSSTRFRHFEEKINEEYDKLIDKNDENVESIENSSWIYCKAILMLVLGSAIAVAFADPLVDAVTDFSNATSISSFFVSFIAMPLATNTAEAVSAIISASRKKQRTTSLTFSEIYAKVTMKNVLSLAVFLALVYLRNLTWDFSVEVLAVTIVCIVMGLFASFRTNFPLWTCLVAYILYPLSLVLVYVLNNGFGWS